jgi:DNA-binding NarL/FixJ family response regulator
MRRLLEDVAPVVVVRTLAQAREQVGRRTFALAILDLGLPDGSGAELVPALHHAQPDLPILVFSELPLPPEAEASVAAVLSKSSTSLEQLVATVKRLIARPERTHGEAAAAPHTAG